MAAGVASTTEASLGRGRIPATFFFPATSTRSQRANDDLTPSASHTGRKSLQRSGRRKRWKEIQSATV